MSSRMECKYCGGLLDDEERGSPRLDSDGDIMCDDCYDEHYRSICPMCGDYYELESEESDIFLLFDEDIGVDPGIYRPTSYPFYSQPLIGSPHVYDGAVELIGGIDAVDSWIRDEILTPATFVCKTCEEKILRKLPWRQLMLNEKWRELFYGNMLLARL